MTTSIWTEEEIAVKFAGCRNLREIIEQLEAEFSNRGEVICEIHVNDVPLDDGDEAKFANSKREEIRKLAVRSNKPQALIADAIQSACVFVPELEKSCLATAELFRGSDLALAQKRFHETLEGCQWLVDTLMHVRGAASNIGEPIAHAERWYEAEKILMKAISELSEAYANRDYVLVADLLEYEVTGAMSIWRDAIEEERKRRIPAVP